MGEKAAEDNFSNYSSFSGASAVCYYWPADQLTLSNRFERPQEYHKLQLLFFYCLCTYNL